MQRTKLVVLAATVITSVGCSRDTGTAEPVAIDNRHAEFAVDVGSETAVDNTTGPYAAVMTTYYSLPAHTVYRPESLADVKSRLPIVSFGNGACINVGNMYAPLLGELASHGYLVIATGPIGELPEFGDGPDSLPQQAPTEAMLRAIDWAVAENAREGGALEGKLAEDRIAVAGHSCGGLQAIASGADPRIGTVAILNSGIIRGGIPNPDGTTREPAGIVPANEGDLQHLHTPVIYLMGGEADQAQPSSEQDFEQLVDIPVFHATLPVGHGGTWREPAGGRMAEVLLAWLDWQLKDKESAAETFIGEPCGLCKNPDWTVKRKNWRVAD